MLGWKKLTTIFCIFLKYFVLNQIMYRNVFVNKLHMSCIIKTNLNKYRNYYYYSIILIKIKYFLKVTKNWKPLYIHR